MKQTVTIPLTWLAGLVAWSVAMKVLASLMIGLWLGERGKRRNAERWATTGHPDGQARAESYVPNAEAEDRFIKAGHEAEKQVVDRMMADESLVGPLRKAGMSNKQIRRDLANMVAGNDVDGPS